MPSLVVLLVASAGTFSGHATTAPLPQQTKTPAPRTFPFTQNEDSDGARHVWFMYQLADYPYAYLPAKTLPTSPKLRFLQANELPAIGDIAWWQEMVAIYDPGTPKRLGLSDDYVLLTAPGVLPLSVTEKKFGPVRWLRYIHPDFVSRTTP